MIFFSKNQESLQHINQISSLAEYEIIVPSKKNKESSSAASSTENFHQDTIGYASRYTRVCMKHNSCLTHSKIDWVWCQKLFNQNMSLFFSVIFSIQNIPKCSLPSCHTSPPLHRTCLVLVFRTKTRRDASFVLIEDTWRIWRWIAMAEFLWGNSLLVSPKSKEILRYSKWWSLCYAFVGLCWP